MSARDWTAAERREKAAAAFDLYMRGFSNRSIANRIECDRKTVPTLIEEDKQVRSEMFATEAFRGIEVYKAVQVRAWTEYANLPPASRRRMIDPETGNVVEIITPAFAPYRTGYLNTVMKAQAEIDKITGAAAPPKGETPAAHLNITINGGGGEADKPANPSLDRLLAEVDGYRLALDEADRRAHGGEPVDTDNPDV